MKRIIAFYCLMLFYIGSMIAQPVQGSEAKSGAITVFTTNAYYVNAKNTSGDRYQFSFRYEILTYKVTREAWAKYPVYALLSTTSEVFQSFTLNGYEERSVFTAPVNSDNTIVNYIRITEVFNLQKQ